MKFRTEIPPIKPPFEINHRHKVLLMGSCFSENIGRKLIDTGFDVCSNPFGIVFNPISIFNQINMILLKKFVNDDDFFLSEGVWKSFLFHSDMNGVILEDTLFNVNNIINKSYEFIKEMDYLVLTFGSSYAFKHIVSNILVANNQKQASSEFLPLKIDPEEIVSGFNEMIDKMLIINDKLKIILTVSPVRHLRYGAIENNRSKARLFNAIEKIENREQVFYYPAFELLMDDLRDYRFYSNDLIHPSDQALQYIWDNFSNTFFNHDTLKINEEIDELRKSLNHRPFFEHTDAYVKFRTDLELRIDKFKENYPYIQVKWK